MPIVLYDLAGADPALRFSPYCWRIRMALAHKGLAVETVPWRFTDTDVIAFSGQGRVPVIRDGETVVADSWAIACYLEAHYPERPSLFGGPTGQAHARLINAWADAAVLGGIVPLVVRDILDAIDPKDRDYFRSSRERRRWMGPCLVGLSFDCQRVDTVFADPWDVRLDALATESGTEHFRRGIREGEP